MKCIYIHRFKVSSCLRTQNAFHSPPENNVFSEPNWLIIKNITKKQKGSRKSFTRRRGCPVTEWAGPGEHRWLGLQPLEDPEEAVLWLFGSKWGHLSKQLVITRLNRCSHFRSFEMCQLGKGDGQGVWLAALCSGEAFMDSRHHLRPREKTGTRQNKTKQNKIGDEQPVIRRQQVNSLKTRNFGMWWFVF